MLYEWIYDFLLKNVRGGYVSYATASKMAAKMSQEWQIGMDSKTLYDLFLRHLQGNYCSYDIAQDIARKMAEEIEKIRAPKNVWNQNAEPKPTPSAAYGSAATAPGYNQNTTQNSHE